MRLNLRGFKVEVLQEAKKLHPGGINPDAITSFQETNRFYEPLYEDKLVQWLLFPVKVITSLWLPSLLLTDLFPRGI